jgi:tRNA G18 (ribose-2'-O)-methylase SpoU
MSSPVESTALDLEKTEGGEGAKLYLLFHNISKKQNIGTMLRSAAAFGVHEVITAGGRFSSFGSKGADRHVPIREFEKLTDATSYLRKRGVKIVGIEICEGAINVASRPFTGSTCFFPGNEGEGLIEMQKAQCDYFVKIRQVGNGTASLNVATATAIVLHTFVEWAGFKENEREAGRDKYIVTAPDLNTLSEAALDKRFQRQLNREIENTSSVDRDT